MGRREILALIGLMQLILPALAAAAEQPHRPVVAVVTQRSIEATRGQMAAFLKGVREIGPIAGEDFDFVQRSTGLVAARAAPLLAELIALDPAVIVTQDTPLTLAGKRATRTIPIVGAFIADPVGFGLVKSVGRPEGNVTGLLSSIDKLVIKQVELLLQVIPEAKRIGVLLNANNPANVTGLHFIEREVPKHGVVLIAAWLQQSSEIDPAFNDFERQRVDAVFLFQDSLLSANQAQIAALARANKLPTMFGFREFVEAGGLMSYGLNVLDQWRRAGTYAARILKGAKPRDVPVEMQPRLELVINLKTARVLGLTIPP